MIKIEKQIKIIIDGDDVKTLTDICELARWGLQNWKFNFNVLETTRINKFSTEIWERTGLD